LVHDCIVESSYVSNNTSEIGYSFPLYLYIKNGIADNNNRPYHKQSNLNKTIVTEISKRLCLQFNEEKLVISEVEIEETINSFAPIDVLDYIYAVLHSPAYRERYKEFLKIDFPRIPYPENAEKFWKLVEMGGKLRQLHLLENVEPQANLANYPIAGNNVVEKASLSPTLPKGERVNSPPSEGLGEAYRVFINDTQYFDNVPPLSWNFYIGGYQPAQKWLKDRKGRTLNFDDILHYQKIIYVLHETDAIMKKIDEI